MSDIPTPTFTKAALNAAVDAAKLLQPKPAPIDPKLARAQELLMT